MVRARASEAAVLGWAGASDWCQCLVLAVASSACDPRCVRCLADQDRSRPPPPLPSGLGSRDPSWEPNSGLTPEPLGPGGGRPLSPGRASEHVQTRRPFARSAPAARSTPRPRLRSAPAVSATAQRGSPQPGGAERRGPGRVCVIATGAGGVRASGLRALRGCGLGAQEGGRPSWPRLRGESCLRGPPAKTPAQAASWIYPSRGQTSLCRHDWERAGLHLLGRGARWRGAFQGPALGAPGPWRMRGESLATTGLDWGGGVHRQLHQPHLRQEPGYTGSQSPAGFRTGFEVRTASLLGGDIRQKLLPLSRSVPKPGFRSAQGFLQSLGELEHRQRQN